MAFDAFLLPQFGVTYVLDAIESFNIEGVHYLVSGHDKRPASAAF